MQKDSVLVSSSVQLKAPHARMPPMKPTISNPANEKQALGLQRNFQIRFTKPSRGGGGVGVDVSFMQAFRGDEVPEEDLFELDAVGGEVLHVLIAERRRPAVHDERFPNPELI